MERFWTWLRDFANEKIKEIHLDTVGHTRICVNCNTWTSEVDGCASLEVDPLDPMFEYMTCKKCGHVSKWDCHGMLPVVVKS